MDKIKLYDNTVYTIADYASANQFVILPGTQSAAEVIGYLTEENLREVHFMTGNGAVTGVYRNQLLCGYTDNGDTLSVNINDADLCRYGLVLDEENRIISAPAQRYAPMDAVIVDKLPEGDITDYMYINNEFIYNPLPKEEVEETLTPSLEERVTVLEETVNTSMSEYKESLLELGVEL